MQATFATQPSFSPRNSPPGFCVGCAYEAGCEAAGYGKPELSSLRHLVKRTGPLGNGEYLYRPATPVRALYAVQTSMAKTVTVDVVGREKVLAFHLPGEVIGLDAACQGQYDNSVVAWQEPVLQVSVRRHPPTRQSPDQRAMAFDAFTEPSTSAIPALRLRPSG